jgi:hypothetical protein
MFSGQCPRYRFLPVDGGFFQHMPHHTELIQKTHAVRKNCERFFNLLKNQTGLETVRVRSQHATMCTLYTKQHRTIVDKNGWQTKKEIDCQTTATPAVS